MTWGLVIALGSSWLALSVALGALWAVYQSDPRRLHRSFTEQVRELSRRQRDLEQDWGSQLDRITKAYRRNAATVSRIEAEQRSELESADETRGGEDVRRDDATGSDNGRVHTLPPTVVAGGIWPGGRSG